MKKALSFLLLVTMLLLQKATAQKQTGKISGGVFFDSSKQALPSATVSLINTKDSTIENITTSNEKGYFTLSGLSNGNYELLITLINFLPYSKPIAITEQHKEIVLDSLLMVFSSDSLAAVVVTAVRPVVLKTDTTEFNAGSFKVRENALAEDILKKLPGIEILKDGSVQAEGEKITQIYVDGKPFFGNDPKMITQNLPANIIDKIQIVDKKSDQAIATKVEDGVREKIINITIKKDKNRGYFGRTYVSYGTAERYEGKVSANYFNKSSKISLVAGGNNTGRNDYGSGEDESSTYNNYSGITKDAQVKLTYVDKWSKKLDVHANAGYSNNINTTEQIRNRQNIFGDSSTYYYERNESTRARNGFNTGFGFDYWPDTLVTIRMNQSANFITGSNTGNAVFNTSLINSKKINDGSRNNSNSNNGPSMSGDFSIAKRFKKRRRSVFLNLNNNINSNFSDAFNISNNQFFPVNRAAYSLVQNQLINNESRSLALSGSASYSEPIGKKSSVNLSLSQNFNNSNSIRETFNFNNSSGEYDIFNDTLSNNFKNLNNTTSIGSNYTYNLKKGLISVGATWQDARTISKQLLKDTVFEQRFAGLVPYLNFNHNNKGKRVSLNYNFSNRAPQAYQLQPIINNSNPLFIRYGNPNLKFSTTHRINTNFNSYNAKKRQNFHSGITFTYVANSISTLNNFDKATGKQTSQPINVDGVYNINSNAGFNKPFKIAKTRVSWNTNTNFNYGRNLSLINFENNISRNYGIRFSSGIDVEIEDLLEFGLKPSINVQTSNFSLRPNLNNNFYTYSCDYGFELNAGNLTEIKMSGNYSKNTGRSTGFNRNINMINADVTQYFNKRKIFWVKLKVYDLLKQNLSVNRFNGESFIEDIQSNVLTRFFLVSINYKINKFTSKR